VAADIRSDATRTEALLERIRHCAMPEGSVECQGTWLRQEGEMRVARGRPWMRFKAEQWFPGTGVDFRWKAWFRMAHIIPIRIVDCFENGRGMLAASVFGFVPVAKFTGSAADRGEVLRGLAELPWRPYAFRQGPHLQWEALPSGNLRVTFDDGQTRASAQFDIDEQGHVLGGMAPSRPRMVGKKMVETPWSGFYSEYRQFGNIRVPTVAEVSWELPEGLFTCWRGRVTEFRVMA
jgi:hypothetical protein